MKTLIVISALLVSNLIFGQQKEMSMELSPSWKGEFDEFQVVLNKDQKFNYLTPDDFSVYMNTEGGGHSQENHNNVKKVIDLKGASIDKFYSDVKNNKDQIIAGNYDIDINVKDTAQVHKILKSVRSTQELLSEIKKLNGVSKLDMISIIETFNPSIKGAQYYTINGFYYTIKKDLVGGYYLALVFPVGKDKKINQ
jgi:hypothetical protein